MSFSDEMHLRNLFSSYIINSLKEKIVRQFQSSVCQQLAAWNIVACKNYS